MYIVIDLCFTWHIRVERLEYDSAAPQDVLRWRQPMYDMCIVVNHCCQLCTCSSSYGSYLYSGNVFFSSYLGLQKSQLHRGVTGEAEEHGTNVGDVHDTFLTLDNNVA